MKLKKSCFSVDKSEIQNEFGKYEAVAFIKKMEHSKNGEQLLQFQEDR